MEHGELSQILTTLLNVQRETLGNEILSLVQQSTYHDDPYESASTVELDSAYAKAWGEIPAILPNRDNPMWASHYADIDRILGKIRAILSMHGLYISHHIKLKDDGTTILHTQLRHNSSQWRETRARIIPAKNDFDNYGSTLNFMKRNNILDLLGISIANDPFDDDAQRSMKSLNDVRDKGVALNTKYNPKEQTYDTITPEQREELEYELAEYPEIAVQVLEGLALQSLADMPKSKFLVAINKIRNIKSLRNGLK